ncbi:hypothetical protein Q4599_00805 [Cellulophaga lytica]|uniref:hypothetical protein n=1 Tax=Cellulophaga lytica TaxID=979 RepID=UPI0026E1DFD2|nr:hypothetical protein [Cellulophaga lytica]MDO6852100.1 hypothetical protein [Cellulophaga lytica]
MEIENQNSETLKNQLKKTKLTMQILTICLIIMFVAVIFVEFTKDGDSKIGMYAAIIFPASFLVIMLDKKYKKIKAELESRK